MAVPSLKDGIDQAGPAVSLVWKPGSAPWTPEVIEPEYAGWRQVAWGEHPGPGTAPEASLDFPRIGGTVQPAPYSEHARTAYRARR